MKNAPLYIFLVRVEICFPSASLLLRRWFRHRFDQIFPLQSSHSVSSGHLLILSSTRLISFSFSTIVLLQKSFHLHFMKLLFFSRNSKTLLIPWNVLTICRFYFLTLRSNLEIWGRFGSPPSGKKSAQKSAQKSIFAGKSW